MGGGASQTSSQTVYLSEQWLNAGRSADFLNLSALRRGGGGGGGGKAFDYPESQHLRGSSASSGWREFNPPPISLFFLFFFSSFFVSTVRCQSRHEQSDVSVNLCASNKKIRLEAELLELSLLVM